MIIGIDASRNKSGGAISHIKGILNEGIDPRLLGIEKIHLWSYDELLNEVNDKEWLIKHSPKELNKGILKQIIWQRYSLPREAKRVGVNKMLYTDASALVGFEPCIVMSRDMLSFEKGQMWKFGFSTSLIRLILIKYMQLWSLNKATGALFLTQYAANVIRKKAKKVSNYRIIPHGVGNMFSDKKMLKKKKSGELFKIVYVSNTSYYKHQWNLVEAVSKLREKGKNIELLLIGANKGVSKEKLHKSILKFDPKNKFVTVTDYLKHKEIIKLTLSSDIFIFASSCENMPNTLIEGMKLGMPILCSDRGPMPEVLKDGGKYFDPESIESIVNTIEDAIINYDSLMSKAERANNLANCYSWMRCSKETYNFLLEI